MIAINESIAKASPINTIATVLMLESLDSFLFKVILLCDFCDFSLLRRRGENLLDKFLFIVMFYRKFRLCITASQATRVSGKAHTPKVARVLRLSLWESSRRSRVRGCFNLSSIPLRRLRRHLSQGERLFVSSIITQIGRENKSSADIYMCIRRGDLRSPAGEHSSPLPCSENILMRTLLKTAVFYFTTSMEWMP